jgi:hypothetical protein
MHARVSFSLPVLVIRPGHQTDLSISGPKAIDIFLYKKADQNAKYVVL